MTMPGGIPGTADYQRVLGSQAFRRLEAFSERFLDENREHLRRTGEIWLGDPLHSWSRQWEYPFVLQEFEAFAADAEAAGTIEVLDAGSGLTFFPFFLADADPRTHVTCCDNDGSLETVFAGISDRGGRVRFGVEDLRRLSFADGRFDLVYCVSVLEHTGEYPRIIDEFARVLRPGGKLVVTFDISIDGTSDIPVELVDGLLGALAERFDPSGWDGRVARPREIAAADVVTTEYAQAFDRRLLPWRYPALSAIKAATARRRIPRSLLQRLTFCCGAYSRPTAED
jgi:SAM-dependent methyltransferase